MMNHTHEQFMARAIALSVDNVLKHQGGPFAALIVKNDEIIGEGLNLVTANNDPTAHAEITAIRNACNRLHDFQLSDCILYTTCEPCPMCFGAIYWARLKSVMYANTRVDAEVIGFDDSLIYKQLMIPHEQRTIPMKQMMHEQAQTAFKLWKESEKKIRY